MSCGNTQIVRSVDLENTSLLRVLDQTVARIAASLHECLSNIKSRQVLLVRKAVRMDAHKHACEPLHFETLKPRSTGVTSLQLP